MDNYLEYPSSNNWLSHRYLSGSENLGAKHVCTSQREADNICSEMTSYYVSNKTADSTALSKHIEQEIVYKNKCETSDTALAAQAGNHCNQGSNRSTKICSNPICLNPVGHLGCDCWEKGGAMEGKRDEVLAKCAKAREERNKKKVEKDRAPNDNSGPTTSGI